ncbi:acetate--CoA ligase family protein [Ktedonobacter racemifer]|uniref:CoA-binding domain protein n=1 Tax=Ktedonobacter racemifer DSM 44963 TaxID=485913 RepID=D6U6S2_KTERA|nr:CoA-binding protein [Ktedonobacter racemifer]EFH80683.1 CoA-binding domain protein [Ktedonobacter racemifer DSM 44963]
MNKELHSLEEVLQPRSVAILGASRSPQKWGHVAARQLIEGGFAGEVYLINPTVSEILGRPTYPSLRDVPGQVDLAVIATSFPHVPGSIEDCIAKGVKGIVLITAGFSETGPEGRALEQDLVARCREHGIRIIGSNCMGLYVRRSKLNALGMVFPLPEGPIGLVSQSGNLGMYFYAQAHLDGCGFTTFLSVGNSVDVSFPECMQYLADDPETSVIAGYVESIEEETLRQVTRDMHARGHYKPAVILLSGATEVGVRASLAHTGSQARVRPDSDTGLFASGVVRVLRSDELFPVAQALALQPTTPQGGRRIAIIGDGGGSSVASGDAVIRAGLEVPVLKAETQAALRELMPSRATSTNPVDVAGAADEDPLSFAHLAEVCVKDPDVDGVIITGLFGGYRWLLSEDFGPREEAAARALGDLVRQYGKPILVQTIYARHDIPALRILRGEGVPYYESVEITCRAMAALSEVGQFLAKQESTAPASQASIR